MSLFKLAIRNALRNVRRTLLTAATVVIGVAFFVVGVSWMTGVFAQLFDLGTRQIGVVRLVTPGWVQEEELLPLHEALTDATTLAAEAAKVEGVTSAFPRLSVPVVVTVNDTIGDTFALAIGAPVPWFVDQMKLGDDLVEGSVFGGDGAGQVMLGAHVAQQAGAHVGDTVLLLGSTRDGAMSPVKGEVIGVVRSGNPLVDQSAFIPLAQAQWMADIDQGAAEVLVYGDRDAAGALAERVRAAPWSAGLVVQPWTEREPLASMALIVGWIQWIVGFLIVLLCALSVWNTMTMSVRERTSEIGVLRALGMRRREVVALFVLEGVLIALAGGALGVVIGGAGGLWLEVNGLVLGDDITQKANVPIVTHMYGDFTPGIALFGLGVAVMTALVGTALPAVAAAVVPPVEAMRARR